MGAKPRQFTLRNLMLAVACFAVALAWVTVNVHSGRIERAVFAIVFVPIVGPAVGGGIGLLIGRFWRRVTMGLLFHLSALAVWILFGPKI
jgi:uncharacterized membrane protein